MARAQRARPPLSAPAAAIARGPARGRGRRAPAGARQQGRGAPYRSLWSSRSPGAALAAGGTGARTLRAKPDAGELMPIVASPGGRRRLGFAVRAALPKGTSRLQAHKVLLVSGFGAARGACGWTSGRR